MRFRRCRRVDRHRQLELDVTICRPASGRSSLIRTTITLEVIVVDAGSFDGCDEMLGERFPAGPLRAMPENVGFGGQQPRRASRGEPDSVLLNPDTELRTARSRTCPRSSTALPDAGLVGCRLLNTTARCRVPASSHFRLSLTKYWSPGPLERRFKAHLSGRPRRSSRARAPLRSKRSPGACMVIDGMLFDALGASAATTSCTPRMSTCASSCPRPAGQLLPSRHRGFTTMAAATQTGPRRFSVVMMRESLNRFLAGLAAGNTRMLSRGDDCHRAGPACADRVCGLSGRDREGPARLHAARSTNGSVLALGNGAGALGSIAITAARKTGCAP